MLAGVYKYCLIVSADEAYSGANIGLILINTGCIINSNIIRDTAKTIIPSATILTSGFQSSDIGLRCMLGFHTIFLDSTTLFCILFT